MPRFIDRALAVAAVVALGAAPALARETSGAPYQVVRAGDNQLGCEALIAEINAINAEVTNRQAEQQKRMMASVSGMMPSRTGSMMSGMAASMIPGGGMLMGMGQAAAADAKQAKMMAEVQKATADAMSMMPLHERMEHLQEISIAKSC